MFRNCVRFPCLHLINPFSQTPLKSLAMTLIVFVNDCRIFQLRWHIKKLLSSNKWHQEMDCKNCFCLLIWFSCFVKQLTLSTFPRKFVSWYKLLLEKKFPLRSSRSLFDLKLLINKSRDGGRYVRNWCGRNSSAAMW